MLGLSDGIRACLFDVRADIVVADLSELLERP